jgi:hypothetical protein
MYDFPLNFQCATTIAKTMIRAYFAKTLLRLDVKVRPCRGMLAALLPQQAQPLLTMRVHPDHARRNRVRGDQTMSMNTLSAASALSGGQSPLLSIGQAKHRSGKHASMADVQMQTPGTGAGASVPLAAGGQPGSKINITA